MREMLEEKLSRFETLESQMADPVVQGDSRKMAEVAREHGSLAKLVIKYRRFKSVCNELDEVREMAGSTDPEERELAESEIPGLIETRENIWNELLESTIGGEDASRTKCVMEIRAGTGGDEAALFARNLYEMYKRYCEIRKWKYEVMGNKKYNPPQLAIRQGDWKFLCKPDGSAAELYNIKKDPAENNNLASKETSIASNMKTILLEWKKTIPTSAY